MKKEAEPNEKDSPTEALLRTYFDVVDEDGFKKLLKELKDKYSEWPEP